LVRPFLALVGAFNRSARLLAVQTMLPRDSVESGTLSFLQNEILCADSLRLLLSQFPAPLAANRLVRGPPTHVARTVRRREDEFALEGRVWISSLFVGV
jgi:hypothetical protein